MNENFDFLIAAYDQEVAFILNFCSGFIQSKMIKSTVTSRYYRYHLRLRHFCDVKTCKVKLSTIKELRHEE